MVRYNKVRTMDVVLSLFPTKDRLQALLSWLRALDIEPEQKYQILMMWCDRLGVRVNGKMIKKAGA